MALAGWTTRAHTGLVPSWQGSSVAGISARTRRRHWGPSLLQRGPTVALAGTDNSQQAPTLQQQLITSPSEALAYARANPTVLDLLGGQVASVEELDEGKINHVFTLGGPGGQKLLLKHAPPYVKSVGQSFQLTQQRLQVEAAALRMVHAHTPAHTPKVHVVDEAASVMVMEHVPFTKVMLGLHKQGVVYPGLPDQLASLLASTIFFTSEEHLSAEAHAYNVARFANAEVVAANERVVLTEPLDASAPANRQLDDAGLREEAASLRSDRQVLSALKELVNAYRQDKAVLMHNDLHTGNLLAQPGGPLYCIDWEFASYGPAGFDVGCLLGVLLLAYLTLQPVQRNPESDSNGGSSGVSSDSSGNSRSASMDVEARRAWLLAAIEQLWGSLTIRLDELRAQHAQHGCPPAGPGAPQGTAASHQQLLHGALGYAAFCIIRLTIGMHSYPGYLFLESGSSDGKRQRAECELRALRLARRLLAMRAEGLQSSGQGLGMQQVKQAVQEVATW